MSSDNTPVNIVQDSSIPVQPSNSIRIFKKSGRPIDPEDELKYKEDWKSSYDKAEKKSKKNVLKLQRMLQYIEFALYKKYYKDVYVRDFNHLREIVIEQNYLSISFGVTDAGELVAVIQDI
jgi:hypothetical protein